MLNRFIRPIIVLVVVLAGGGVIYNVMHPGAKRCNSLVSTANSAIDVFNKESQAATPDVKKVAATLKSTAAKLRKDAGDYKSPFDGDAPQGSGRSGRDRESHRFRQRRGS